MNLAFGQLSRVVLPVCTALFALASVPVHATPAPPANIKDFAAERAARKEIAAQGKPLPGTPDLERLEERLAKKGLPEEASILIRIFKAESELEVWMSRGAGAGYALFAKYPICMWSGTLGPKLREGDRQAPEGFYTVTLPQAHPGGSRHPQAINIGFPNPFDKVHSRSGSHILIHGGCASIGCFAMTNGVNEEVHKLTLRAFDAGQSYIHIHSFPFRMTAENLTRYDRPDWNEFWANLKEGYDFFEDTRRPPRISVCGRRYDFTKVDQYESDNPGPIAVCPRTATLMAELEDLATGVAEEQAPAELSKAAFTMTAYLDWPRRSGIIRDEPNSEHQLASRQPRSIISAILARPLPCSLALPGCRKYAAVRESIVHKATFTSSRHIVRKYWKKKKHKKRKKRWHRKRRHH